MKLSVKVPRSKNISQFDHCNTLEFVVESSEHESSRECFTEIGGTVKAINRDAYAIFKDALDDLHE
jgi:hypothetical protein